jgi:hypothetical protein
MTTRTLRDVKQCKVGCRNICGGGTWLSGWQRGVNRFVDAVDMICSHMDNRAGAGWDDSGKMFAG